MSLYKKMGSDQLMWSRSAGRWPSVAFIGAPLKLPSGSFGLGQGAGAHAPHEYWIIDSSNPKVAWMDGAAKSLCVGEGQVLNGAFARPHGGVAPRGSRAR